MYRVVITGPAKRDVQDAYDWWGENRSVEQAGRWHAGISAAIRSLHSTPERCSLASEYDLMSQGVRQLLFGLGRRPTHRIIFVIDDDAVVVLRVRHTSQDALAPDDLGQ